MQGLILKIDRFAIHDGPGIRTVVYMQGCPLHCKWCSTPESQRATPHILHVEIYCRKCGRCAEVCPLGAVILSGEEGVIIERDLCSNCGQCAKSCPYGAMRLVGNYMAVDEVFEKVKLDRHFYRRSNGGVTISGGEPTTQMEFVSGLLRKCKEQYLHTAIETCGFSSWIRLEMLLPYLDLVYFDIKHMDRKVHRKLTGVSNEVILENARKVCTICPMVLRIPVVPGYNDSGENMVATARFAAQLGENFQRIELLYYHRLGEATYKRLGREYKLKGVEPCSQSHMESLREIVERCGVIAKIGG